MRAEERDSGKSWAETGTASDQEHGDVREGWSQRAGPLGLERNSEESSGKERRQPTTGVKEEQQGDRMKERR